MYEFVKKEINYKKGLQNELIILTKSSRSDKILLVNLIYKLKLLGMATGEKGRNKLKKEKLVKEPKVTSGKKKTLLAVKNNWQLYLMALPAIVLLFCFNYMPMGGLIIAFKKYSYKLGIFGSPWSDPWYKNFILLFRPGSAALFAMKNTLIMNALFIGVGTIVAVALAICFNEITNKWIKSITQSLSLLPYFISTVVIGVFISGLLSYDSGVINKVITFFGGEKIAFYQEPGLWPGIMLIVYIWHAVGYKAIIYMASISGIDESLYEAAMIDGANRWQQIKYITLPLLKPTVITMTLLAVGKIMNSDFGLFYNVTGDVPLLYETVDVIDTYIYRALRELGDMGISSATSFFQSIVGFVLVMISNHVAKKYEEGSALF